MVEALKYLDGRRPPGSSPTGVPISTTLDACKNTNPRSVPCWPNAIITPANANGTSTWRKFGFVGEVLRPVLANAGGFHLDQLDQLRTPGPVAARLIVLKGYQGMFGRALTGLVASKCVRTFCATMKFGLLRDRRKSLTPLRCWRSRPVSTSRSFPIRRICCLMRCVAERISIGLSVSDGASTSFLEALAMGSFRSIPTAAAPVNGSATAKPGLSCTLKTLLPWRTPYGLL